MSDNEFRTHLTLDDLRSYFAADVDSTGDTDDDLHRQVSYVLSAYRGGVLPGLHPLEIAEGAVLGFTVFQAESVLGTPRLLDQLRRLWHGKPPSARIHRIAAAADERGRLHAHLLSAVSAEPAAEDVTARLRTLRVLQPRSDLPISAAAEGGSPVRSHSEIDSEHQFRLTRTALPEEGRLHVVIEFVRDADLHIATLLIGAEAIRLFIVLEQQGPLAVGESFIDIAHGWGEIAVTEPVVVQKIPEAQAADLSRSAAACPPGVHPVWARLASSLPTDHWARAAIAEGMP
ncbi:hypothetical protein DFR70_102323 [Nocardia tenerifensis]|uniref:Uncharacterized protein n=1 Tax=Nocardia tenerifensis TaxID=228006 RepID=A0A318KC75_9NOCA|nr:hypothetical protein [Nocardia tenerifensis]PXX68639.1 hypothetical protein DFR70_102323 [Nocardia tenerifensis]